MNRSSRQTAADITGHACTISIFIAGGCGLIAIVASYPALALLAGIAAVLISFVITLLTLSHRLTEFSSKDDTLLFLLKVTAGLLAWGILLVAPQAFCIFVGVLLVIAAIHFVLKEPQP